MTLDEAIKHAREKAEEQRKDNDTCVVKEGYGCKDCAYYYSKPCIECAEEHEQLADWLEELKEYKENKHRSLRYMYEKGYKKAIDETCNYICCEWSLDRINTCEDFDKISQQLKEGGIDE